MPILDLPEPTCPQEQQSSTKRARTESFTRGQERDQEFFDALVAEARRGTQGELYWLHLVTQVRLMLP